jgi:hypothetical protein
MSQTTEDESHFACVVDPRKPEWQDHANFNDRVTFMGAGGVKLAAVFAVAVAGASPLVAVGVFYLPLSLVQAITKTWGEERALKGKSPVDEVEINAAMVKRFKKNIVKQFFNPFSI